MEGVNVKGNCPMGCGQTLFLGAGGRITCSFVACPRPSAVDELLDENESEHIVEVWADGFTVLHALRERLDHELMNCTLHHWMHNLTGPPVRPGRYRVTATGDSQSPWRFEKIG